MAIQKITSGVIESSQTLTTPTISSPTITSPTISSPTITGNTTFDSGTLFVDATNDKVGIGTTTPSTKLEVKAGSGSIVCKSTSGIGLKTFYDDGRTEFTSVNYDGTSTTGAQDYYLTSGANLYFRTNSNSSTVSAILINTSGQAIVNDVTTIGSSPEKLQVWATSPSGGNQYGVVIGGNSTTYSVYAMRFVNTYVPTAVGYISIGSSSTTYATSSDYRLKENVAPMTGALATVSLLKPVTYKWKLDGKDGQGFIAHELQEVVPECVTGEKDAVDADGNPEYQGVDTSFLVATLTAAIQEQQTIINDLKSRIEALEAK